MSLLTDRRALTARPGSTAHAVSVAISAGDGLSFHERLVRPASRPIADANGAEKGRLFIDLSVIVRHDAQTGIQRVLRSLARELYLHPPAGRSVELVYLTSEGGRWHYRYARRWTARLFSDPLACRLDEPTAFQAGDVLLIADLNGHYGLAAAEDAAYERLKAVGVHLTLIVYDLIPLQAPEYVSTRLAEMFPQWLAALVGVVDGAVCISKAVSDDLLTWVRAALPQRLQDLQIGWFHLGSDIQASNPTRGAPVDFEAHQSRFKSAPTFLMVGTIEPRKGHLQTIDAFERLWAKGLDVNLVVIGRVTWKGLEESDSRNVPQIETRLQTHVERGRRLFWYDNASDELLERVYALKPCLIAASELEGFGLPLIEAARHGAPIIARDIPVFREVAGEHAYYFSGLGSRALAKAIEQWLALSRSGDAPASLQMPWLTWSESAAALIDILDRHEGLPQKRSTLP
jgi:glycosyltransferase involved in cell wall biosynthesis